LSNRLRLGLQVVTCLIWLVVPRRLARHLGLPEATGLQSLACLASRWQQQPA
jgi:hypothetical protein